MSHCERGCALNEARLGMAADGKPLRERLRKRTKNEKRNRASLCKSNLDNLPPGNVRFHLIAAHRLNAPYRLITHVALVHKAYARVPFYAYHKRPSDLPLMVKNEICINPKKHLKAWTSSASFASARFVHLPENRCVSGSLTIFVKLEKLYSSIPSTTSGRR